MPYTRTADDAVSPRWCDLPADLLGEVSRRLHVAADYVRFHAVCTPWRDALPPPPRRPALLPWLLAPRDAATGHRRARCVPFFPSPCLSKTSRRYAAATIELRLCDKGWVIHPDGGAAALLLLPGGGAGVAADDPLTGSATTNNSSLPPWSDVMDAWADHATVVVSGDGTALVYAFESGADETFTLNVALLHPGDTVWTLQRHDLYANPNRCCMAYHNGNIVQCYLYSWSNTMATAAAVTEHASPWMLLGLASMAGAPTLSLGATSTGGYGTDGATRCRLFKYSFLDDRTEFLEQLPKDWNNHEACMWLTPQPAIASTEEIEGTAWVSKRKATKLDPTRYGAYFRIYVGNLPRKMDSYRLRQFFSKHGKVADARVMCHRETGRSRGFGFVTMAIEVGNEPSDAISKLDGQCLDGRILRVKFADPELETKAGAI
ncbi:hypothetical protein ACP4OV_015004 [Aristida adscensionis]